MKLHSKLLGLFLCSSIIAGLSSVVATAGTKITRSWSCYGLTLDAAWRDPANNQSWSYKLSGFCGIIENKSSTSYGTTTSKNSLVMETFTTISAKWDSDTQKASELIVFEGPMYGEVSAGFRCDHNPFEATRGCVVTGLHHANDSLGYIADRISKFRIPISANQIDPDAAAELAQNSSTSPPPPPPPPAETPEIKIFSGLMFKDPIVLEGENLTNNVHGQGRASPQNMAGFGSSWSNNGHLFWAPEGVGSLLTIPLESSGQSGYKVTVHLTKAPDFAKVRAYIRYGTPDGGTRDTYPADFDAYAQNVSGPSQISLSVPDTDGNMDLVIITMGKSDASTGLYSGIDRIQIERTP